MASSAMTFTAAEAAACERLATWALEEDLDQAGDLTSQAIVPPELAGRAAFVARASGVVAGLPAVTCVFRLVDPAVAFHPTLPDGARVQRGDRLATVSGAMRSILAGERTALNFLQRLCGIATQTARYVEAVTGHPCRVLDTRKTTPGWRLLEKYAVRMGGGHNHRVGLFDGVLIKDNHLAALGTGPDVVARAVALARQRHGQRVPIEVEVDTLEQLEVALTARPDIVLLDNMPPALLRQAVARRNAVAPGVLLESSGGVTLATLPDIAATGVDRVSVGALTHSAVAMDIGLDYLT
jgi:nicotinate-nucleotide pyrophosphorylase (carboxylating)